MNREQRLAADGCEAVDPILFYGPRNSFGWASNFHQSSIHLPNPFTGEICAYPTGEHRYQAMKANDPEQHDWVKNAATPGQSKDRGRNVNLRDGWGDDYGDLCWYVMFETVLAKAIQHPDIEFALGRTKGRPMYEDSPTDDIWGWRYAQDYRGKNLLGRCWMQVRDVVCA